MKKHLFLSAFCTTLLLAGCNDDSTVYPSNGDPQPPKVDEDKPTTCTDACSGNTVCANTGALKLCQDENGDGCKEWVTEACPDKKHCENGECVPDTGSTPTCINECDESTCLNESTLRLCKDANNDGCKEWVIQTCPEQTACSNGTCMPTTPTCKDTCTGTTQCDGTTGYQTCMDTNGDGCREWSATENCASGTECKAGKCEPKQAEPPQCTDACKLGTTQCKGDNTVQTCKDTNGDTCTEWSSSACTTGLKCNSGKCVCKYTSVEEPSIHPMPDQSSFGKSENTTVNSFHDEYIYDSSNKFKIGARREWGGSIVFFGEAGSGPGTNATNTVDGNDTGREVQVAIYDSSRVHQGCAYNASCNTSQGSCPGSITFMGWNPVQGGNRCNRGSGVDSVTNKDGVLEIVTTPLHWNPNWDASSCVSDGCERSDMRDRRADVRLTQRLRFVDPLIVELFYTVVNLSDISHTPTVQELPTLYATYGAHGFGNYNRLMTASKEQISIDIPANDGFFQKPFTSSEPWVTLQNKDLNYGVGILYENGLLEYTGWQKANVFNNVRSNIKFGLKAKGSVNARAYLLLGSYDTIAANAAKLQKTLAPFGVLDVPASGSTVSGDFSVGGWALDNRQVTKVVAKIDDDKETALTYGGSRQDVCDVWVGYPHCPKVGFSGTVSTAGLSNACAHKLEIIATDSDGNKRTIARRLIQVK